MRSRSGWTLVEVMVVVLIVSILAAILVPLLTARIEAARWSEGKAGAGMIATAVRAYVAEMQEPEGTGLSGDVFDYIPVNDLEGRYFNSDCYSFTGAPAMDDAGVLTYEITVNSQAGYHPELFTRVTTIALDQTGVFADTTGP